MASDAKQQSLIVNSEIMEEADKHKMGCKIAYSRYSQKKPQNLKAASEGSSKMKNYVLGDISKAGFQIELFCFKRLF